MSSVKLAQPSEEAPSEASLSEQQHQDDHQEDHQEDRQEVAMSSVKSAKHSEEAQHEASPSEQHQEEPRLQPGRSVRAKLRCARTLRLADRFPRITTLGLRVFLPLFLLIVVASAFGFILAQLEAPNECDFNDQVIARKFLLNSLPVNETISLIGSLPAWCFSELLKDENRTTINATLPEIERDVIQRLKQRKNMFKDDEDLNDSIAVLEEILSVKWVDWWEDWTEDSMAFMQYCGERVEDFVRLILSMNTRISVAEASRQTTFNWIRCWNISGNGNFLVSPTPEVLYAAANQDEFYRFVWQIDQSQLLTEYLDDLGENANWTEKALAWESSILDASGRSGCIENLGGSAWFWFVIMTTVGYGNQAPVTDAGRRLVMSLGLLSIIAFGAVLALAGNVVKVLFEDMTSRSRYSRVLARHGVGSIIWGTIALFWFYFIGARTGIWWKNRLDFETTESEQFWFGFISSTTVGLGDFYLNPEVMLMRDVFMFALMFLSGFVFTSAFLNNLGDFLSGLLPRIAPSEKLKAKLARTNLVMVQELSEELPQVQAQVSEINPPVDEAEIPKAADLTEPEK